MTDRIDQALPAEPIFGIPVSAINLGQAVDRISRWIDRGSREYVCVTDAHCIIQAHSNPKIGAIYHSAGMVTPDGMPLVWMCRWAGHKNTSRVYGPDLMQAVLADPHLRQKRHYFYGGAEGVARKLVANLSQTYPGLTVAGLHCPPFSQYSDAQMARVIADINATAPDIIWVGLGAPKQEIWMANNRAALDASVMVGVGAAFDFLSGAKPQAPLWMQANGLEWLFRMASEPRRLIPRYASTIPPFIYLAILQITGLRRYAAKASS
jgi:N-acetylglucosaminyldiphosphoundecaprenol N-acetyl-beta-D-mannosaminyltransferase